MFRTSHESEILRAIVGLVAIYVMNDFGSRNIAPERALNGENVLKDVPVFAGPWVSLALNKNVPAAHGSPALPLVILGANPLPTKGTEFFLNVREHRLASVPRYLTGSKTSGLGSRWRIMDPTIPGSLSWSEMRLARVGLDAQSAVPCLPSNICGGDFGPGLIGAANAFIPGSIRFAMRLLKAAFAAELRLEVLVFLVLAALLALPGIAEMIFQVAPSAAGKLLGINFLAVSALGAHGDISTFHRGGL